jgi:hypothetical protein
MPATAMEVERRGRTCCLLCCARTRRDSLNALPFSAVGSRMYRAVYTEFVWPRIEASSQRVALLEKKTNP